jgi:putative toxin-antitoxin system antitoxin component (TIGR02293 family)
MKHPRPSPVSAARTAAVAARPLHFASYPTHDEIAAGYGVRLVQEVAGRLGIPTADLARRIGVARSTFHRTLKGRARLTEHESDALARHSSLLSQALAVFDGDETAARKWLGSAQIGLGDAVPLDLAQTTFGFREVEKLLTRIDHGVYA